MDNIPVKGLVDGAQKVLAILPLIFLSSLSLHGQGPNRKPNVQEAPTNPARVKQPNRNPSIREREFKMREMEQEASRPPTAEETELALKQIGEDFERLQAVNNKMMSAAAPAKTLDYKNIAKTTAEIRERAARLKTNLHLPQPEQIEAAPKRPDAETDEQLKASLLTLDKAIMSFVTSPLFKSVDVIDAKVAAKASHDLETIIELSRIIGQNAERLDEASKKSRP